MSNSSLLFANRQKNFKKFVDRFKTLLSDISVKLLYSCLLLFDVTFVFSEITQIYALVNTWIGKLVQNLRSSDIYLNTLLITISKRFNQDTNIIDVNSKFFSKL